MISCTSSETRVLVSEDFPSKISMVIITTEVHSPSHRLFPVALGTILTSRDFGGGREGSGREALRGTKGWGGGGVWSRGTKRHEEEGKKRQHAQKEGGGRGRGQRHEGVEREDSGTAEN